MRAGTFLPLSWQHNLPLEQHLALSKYLPITRGKSKLRTACATENALAYITMNTEKLLQRPETVDTPPPPPTLAREKQGERTAKGAMCQQSGCSQDKKETKSGAFPRSPTNYSTLLNLIPLSPPDSTNFAQVTSYLSHGQRKGALGLIIHSFLPHQAQKQGF